MSDDITFLVRSKGFNLAFSNAFEDEIAIFSLSLCLKIIRKVGCVVNDALLSKPEPGDQETRIAVQVAKFQHDEATWEPSIARPLRNILCNSQRESLVACLIANPPVGQGNLSQNPNELCTYYPVDPEMDPLQLISCHLASSLPCPALYTALPIEFGDKKFIVSRRGLELVIYSK